MDRVSGRDSTRQTETVLTEKLEEARERYRFAAAQFQKLKDEYQTMPPSDGHFAYRQALRIETDALSQYSNLLRMFTHLVRYGALPEEPKDKIV